MTTLRERVKNIESLKVKMDKAYEKALDLDDKIRKDKQRLTTLIHPGYMVGGSVDLGLIMNTNIVEPYGYGHTSYHVPTRSTTELKRILISPKNPESFIISDNRGNLMLYEIEKNLPIVKNKWKVDTRNSVKAIPTAFAWSPDGKSIVATYPTKEDNQQQVSFIILDEERVVDTSCFYKAHKSGEVKGITFIKESSEDFVTGGKDHRVMYWKRKEENWDCAILHDTEHSKEITGMSDCKQKNVIYSVGRDRKLVGFDYSGDSEVYSRVMNNPGLNVHLNPTDPNLLLIYVNDRGKQLQLFDTRKAGYDVQTRGWTHTQSQKSTLVNQHWSPNGWLIACGSVDLLINLYDIRYDPGVPAYSIDGIKGSVYDADFHPSRPLLLSVSGDSLIGLHELR